MVFQRIAVVVAACVGVVRGQADCCAFGGTGAVTLMGTGIIGTPSTTTAAQPSVQRVAVGTSGQATAPFATVLIGPFTSEVPSPNASAAGWIVQQNATHQTLTFWLTGEWCNVTSIALPQIFSRFSACRGGDASMSLCA